MLDLGRTFLQSVERSPDAPAIVDGDLTLTYAQWLPHVSRVARGLQALGLLPGSRVLSLLQNRWEAATLHWACQLSGIVIVPLNWRVKPDELDYCLGDAQVRAIVYEPVTAAAVGGSTVAPSLIRIGIDDAQGATLDFDSLGVHDVGDDARGSLSRQNDGDITPVADADDISLMLYTSGTTGRPKGVPRRHRHERAAALAHVAQNIYRQNERTLGVMPLYHTMGVRSLLAMALVDGLFVCIRRWQTGTAIAAISRYELTCLYLVPTLYHDLLADPSFTRDAVRSVRKVGFAGSPMSDGLLQRTSAAFEPEMLVNHYGSSEVYTVSIDQHAARKPGSAGRAGINARMRILRLGELDPNAPSARAARGEEGQIAVELLGDEAFEGYWQRPEANQKALRDGWYLTGDLGFIDPDGDLFVTGRVDDMIISGGENISPVEVESLLSLHPSVDEVAVVGLPDERWGQRVVAFIKRHRDDPDIDPASLDAYCNSSGLVNFKRPRQYVFVDEIPKSPVGKILRRKLTAASAAEQAKHASSNPYTESAAAAAAAIDTRSPT